MQYLQGIRTMGSWQYLMFFMCGFLIVCFLEKNTKYWKVKFQYSL